MCFILPLFFLAAAVFGPFWRFPQNAGQEGYGCGFNERAEHRCAVNVLEIILL